MKVRIFELCDAAVIRNGMITVVNGGINLMGRDEFPAALSCYVAISVDTDVPEEGLTTTLTLAIEAEDGTELNIEPLDMPYDVLPSAAVGRRDTPLILPSAIDVNQMTVPKAGQYRMVLRHEAEELSSIRFTVELSSAGQAGSAQRDGIDIELAADNS